MLSGFYGSYYYFTVHSGFSFHLALSTRDVEEVAFDDVLTEKEARAILADYIGKGNTWNRFYNFILK